MTDRLCLPLMSANMPTLDKESGDRAVHPALMAGRSTSLAAKGKWTAMWLRGRHRQLDLRPVSSQRIASHQFDRWPVLTEEVRCVVEIVRPHLNTAGLSAGAVRYLKVKIESDGFRIFFDRLI